MRLGIERSPMDFARCYAEHLGWPVLPGHWLIQGGWCSCRRRCPSPGAHPLMDPWTGYDMTDPDDVREWWTTYPNASVLTVPRGFLGISVPKRWGAVTMGPVMMGLGAEDGSFDLAPVLDGRGSFTFLTLPAEDGELEPLVWVAETYGEAVVRVSGADSFLPLPPTGRGTSRASAWLSSPLVGDRGAARPLPATSLIVRGLVEAAVMMHGSPT